VAVGVQERSSVPKSWPELRIRKPAAHTRIVSGGESCPSQRELSRHLKYIDCVRIPEFESYDPSHAVVSSAVMTRVPRRKEPSALKGVGMRRPDSSGMLPPQSKLHGFPRLWTVIPSPTPSNGDDPARPSCVSPKPGPFRTLLRAADRISRRSVEWITHSHLTSASRAVCERG
jgi:hypothetical protein